MDHNEIVGWEGAPRRPPSAPCSSPTATSTRASASASSSRRGCSSPDADAVVEVETEGETRTERLLWAVMLGDLVSLQLAARRGVDPTPVEVIERLKDELGRP